MSVAELPVVRPSACRTHRSGQSAQRLFNDTLMVMPSTEVPVMTPSPFSGLRGGGGPSLWVYEAPPGAPSPASLLANTWTLTRVPSQRGDPHRSVIRPLRVSGTRNDVWSPASAVLASTRYSLIGRPLSGGAVQLTRNVMLEPSLSMYVMPTSPGAPGQLNVVTGLVGADRAVLAPRKASTTNATVSPGPIVITVADVAAPPVEAASPPLSARMMRYPSGGVPGVQLTRIEPSPRAWALALLGAVSPPGAPGRVAGGCVVTGGVGEGVADRL